MGFVLRYTPEAADEITDFVLEELAEDIHEWAMDDIEREMARLARNPKIAGPPDDWLGPVFIFQIHPEPDSYAIRATFHFMDDEVGLLVTSFAWAKFSR